MSSQFSSHGSSRRTFPTAALAAPLAIAGPISIGGDTDALERRLDGLIAKYDAKEAHYLRLIDQFPPSAFAEELEHRNLSEDERVVLTFEFELTSGLAAADEAASLAFDAVLAIRRDIFRLRSMAPNVLRMKAKAYLCGYHSLRLDGHDDIADLLEQLARS